MKVGTRKYDDDQRAGVIAAGCDQGLTAPKVVAAAAAGKLRNAAGELVPAFDIPVNTVQDLVRIEKHERNGTAPQPRERPVTGDLVLDLDAQAGRILETAFKRLENKQKRGRLEPREALDWLRVLREYRSQKGTAPAKTDDDTAETPEPPKADTLSTIAARLNGGPSETTHAAHETTVEAVATAQQPTSTDDNTTTKKDDTRISSRTRAAAARARGLPPAVAAG